MAEVNCLLFNELFMITAALAFAWDNCYFLESKKTSTDSHAFFPSRTFFRMGQLTKKKTYNGFYVDVYIGVHFPNDLSRTVTTRGRRKLVIYVNRRSRCESSRRGFG